MADSPIYTGYFVNTDGNIRFVSLAGSLSVIEVSVVDTGVALPSYVGIQNSYEYRQLLLWRSFRAHQSYPFNDSAGNNGVPKDLILDISLTIPPGGLTEYQNKFYIHKILTGSQTLRILLWYKDSLAEFLCGSFLNIPMTLTLHDVDYYTYSNYVFTAAHDIPLNYAALRCMTGNICIGNTAGYTLGTIILDYSSGRISQACVHLAQFSCVLSILCDGKRLTGDIKLIAGPGVVISAALDNTIIISVDYGSLYNGISSVLDAVSKITTLLGTPVTSINGILPNLDGNINIVGVDCVLTASPGRGVITVSNKCAKPCCTSVATTDIENNIKTLLLLHLVIKSYFTLQADNINYMQANLATIITGSK